MVVDIIPSAGFLPISFLRKGDQPQHWSICFDVRVNSVDGVNESEQHKGKTVGDAVVYRQDPSSGCRHPFLQLLGVWGQWGQGLVMVPDESLS